jgi:fructuronate reductase
MRSPREGQGAPIRHLHLGLGGFFRAHVCWYTQHSPEADGWGIAAFTGRASGDLVRDLVDQHGLYTLVTRGSRGDAFEVIGSLCRAHTAGEHEAWLAYFRDPTLAVVTLTVTEAGYRRRAGGGVDLTIPDVRDDLESMQRDPATPVRTVPARLVAGLAARRQADAGPLALVPCDNVSGNGAMARQVVLDLAERIDAGLAAWVDDCISVPTTMVDRITPRTTAKDMQIVRAATGRDDRRPVVTEPFSEWVLTGAFPRGRPGWESAGATLTDDVTPFEERKLWLLNGGHSLLAYAGSIVGHVTVADAAGDETCRAWLEQWWSEASAHLGQPARALAAYRSALVERFANPRIGHRLEQIAADGSHKLPIRVVPVLRAERADGRLPEGATRIIAAWICHLRGLGAPVTDARAGEVVALAGGSLAEAARRILAFLDPALGGDEAVRAAVVEQSRELARMVDG